MTESQIYYDKMTKTPLTRLIVSLGIPTTISMLVTNIYNMADTYFVGTLGESQQAATGILFTLQAIIQAIAFMLGQGSGTMVSKSLAEQKEEEASKYVSSAFFSGLALGTVLMILGLLFLSPFMRLLGSTETILPYARQYGACVLITCPIMMGSFVLNNNLRYEGKAFYAMIGLVTGGLLNIFGDYLLVIVFELGVLGAGLATAISQLVSFCILLYFFKKMAQSSIKLSAVSKDFTVYAIISKVGFPAIVRQGLSSISSGLLNNLTRPYGDAAIAAMSVVNRFAAFIMCVGVGVGLFLALAAIRILFQLSLKAILTIFYGILLIFLCISASEMIPVAFDSGGVTTGPMSVPFILAMGLGFSASRAKHKSKKIVLA